MFCALYGATRTPRRANARHSAVVTTVLPASEVVPATSSALMRATLAQRRVVVPGPLMIRVVRPRWRVPMQQVLAAAAILVLTGPVLSHVGLVTVGVLVSAAA